MSDKWTEWFGTKTQVSVSELVEKLVKLQRAGYSNELIIMLVAIAVTTPDASDVTVQQFRSFVVRFGPFETCVEKAVKSLFLQLNPPIPHRWFHGNQDRKSAAKIMSQDEAAMGTAQQSGHFLVRFSDKYPNDLVLSYSKFKEGKLCYKSVVVKNSPEGYFMSEKKPIESFPTVHALIESERAKKSLNHSIVSKIHRSAVARVKRDSYTAPPPKPEVSKEQGKSDGGSVYQRWNPTTAVLPDELSKPSQSESHAYSIWHAGAAVTPSDDRRGGDTGYAQMPSSSSSMYSAFTPETNNTYGSLPDVPKDKSKS